MIEFLIFTAIPNNCPVSAWKRTAFRFIDILRVEQNGDLVCGMSVITVKTGGNVERFTLKESFKKVTDVIREAQLNNVQDNSS